MKIVLTDDYNLARVDSFSGTPTEVEQALRTRWTNVLRDVPEGAFWACIRELTRSRSVVQLEGEDIPPIPSKPGPN